MDEFHIGLIENQSDKRRVSLLKYIYYNKNYFLSSNTRISMNKLIEKLKISKSTLENDIEYFLDKYQLPFYIDSNLKFLYLDKCNLHLIRNAARDIYTNTISFILLSEFYKDTRKTQVEWSEYFHVSYPQFRRYISHLNHQLKKYDIALKNTILTIEGDEIDIRYFYSDFFNASNLDVYNYSTSLSDDLCQAVITQYNKIGLPNLDVDFNHLTSFFQIVIDRFSLGKRISLNKNILDKYIYSINYLNFKSTILKIWYKKNKFASSISEPSDSDLVYSYIMLLNSINYTNSKLITRADENYSRIEYFYNFTSSVLMKTKIDPIYHNQVTKVLQAFLINIYHLSKITNKYQMKNQETKNYIKDNEKQLFNIWLEECTLFFKNNSMNFFYIEDIAITLTMLSAGYLKDNKENTQNILFSLSGEAGYQSYLSDYLKSHFGSSAKLFFHTGDELTKDKVKYLNVNILITNYFLNKPIDGVKYIQLSYHPSVAEIIDLMFSLKGLEINKNDY